jgi:large subunit ribosomal protein L9
MKVVLLQDVYKQGVAGEVVDVADGFARNYLIPQGLALKATPRALKRSEELRAQVALRRAKRDEELNQIAERLQDVTLLFGVKAGETGKLYGSVTSTDIADALLEEVGIEFDRRRVGDRPLRELGEHMVPIRLSATLTPSIRVVLHREGEEPPVLEATGEEAVVETAVAEEMEAIEDIGESPEAIMETEEDVPGAPIEDEADLPVDPVEEEVSADFDSPEDSEPEDVSGDEE